MMYSNLKNIDDFYTLLEKIEPTSDDLSKIPYKMDYLLNMIDNPDILKAETDCLKFKTEDGKLLPLHNYHDDKGNEVIIPNIRDFNDEIFNYIKDRQGKTNNIALKAKYGHILWHSKKDFEALKITIDSYLALTDLFAEKDKNEPDEHYGLSVKESFINAFFLSLPTKYNFEVVKNKTIELIYNYFPQSSSFHLLRVKLIELMVENKKHFELKDFNGLQKICWEMALTYNGINFTTDFFNLGHKIDLITEKQTYEWDKAKAEYFEKLMKDAESSENNLAAPTFCKEALDIYMKMNNKDKIAELEEKFTFLARSQRLSTFETKPVDITESVNQYRGIANDFSAEQIIQFFMHGSILPKYEDTVELAKERLNNSPLLMLGVHELLDHEGNIVKYYDDDASILKQELFKSYDFFFQVENRCLLALLEESCKNKRLNSRVIIKFLTENTWFGTKITKNLINNQSIEYRWIDYISPSITSYFKKMNNFISRNGKFYPIFIQEIDSLTLKIEGMMRDLIDFFKIKGFNTIKHCYDNNNRKIVQKKNINAFLWDKNIFEIFPVDDVWFLRYLLIETINLRNDVAHCLFSSPKQYNIVVMHLILIAILRLSKFNIKINSSE